MQAAKPARDWAGTRRVSRQAALKAGRLIVRHTHRTVPERSIRNSSQWQGTEEGTSVAMVTAPPLSPGLSPLRRFSGETCNQLYVSLGCSPVCSPPLPH